MVTATDSYDFIVVGAGTAGCVVAARLSEDNATRVLLVEAGGATPLPASAEPPLWHTLLDTEANWGGIATTQAATGTNPRWARGKGIGGSSAINAMMFVRGHKDSYDRWQQFGAKGWTFDDLLPYFKRCETAAKRDPALRGMHGPLKVGPAKMPNPVLTAAWQAALDVGHPRASDVSGGVEVGFGHPDAAIVNGRRQSAGDAYLTDALKRPNLTFLADALVHRLQLENGRCTGIEYTTGTERSVLTAAAGEVILAAGAIGSPQVLMRSGIGPQSHLRAVGIEVEADLPGVGSNLQDHPLTGVVYKAKLPVPQGRHNHGDFVGLVRTPAAETGAPDVQILPLDDPATAGLDIPNGYMIAVSALQPYSRGTVRLTGPDPQAAPLVDPNYLADDRDMQTLLRGMSIARQIGNAAPLNPWRAEELAPGPQADNEDALRQFIRATTASYFHYCGTCAMGDTPESVVDSTLRVHGIDGLRVVDASVMPTIPSNNTMASVYGLAERGADLIRHG
ncbi:GMC family oxidoreductase [Mycobacterium kubicae]|uniref:GMC family oxidoreductase n=1 Tax=Mycobacterium kubicae TaxID=120959 RepID=UPI0007FB807F|nr:FAD-dependent oxidoreductase [Mycobacterium kubicae]OBK50471.1 choline dehydrogenase [Mycobacterium kubicae]